MGSFLYRAFFWSALRLFPFTPTWALRLLINRQRDLFGACPPGREFVDESYLGHFSVWIDSGFPIEYEMFYGVYETETLDVIRLLVRPGDVCVDVGANIGAISLALADAVGSHGKVHFDKPNQAGIYQLRVAGCGCGTGYC